MIIEDFVEGSFDRIKGDDAFSFDNRLDELMDVCELFNNLKLTPPFLGDSHVLNGKVVVRDADFASLGNLSYRVNASENVFDITGSRLKVKTGLTSDSFARVSDVVFPKKNDLEKIVPGKIFYRGKTVPSMESPLHHAIYVAMPRIGAVFHFHYEPAVKHAQEKGLLVTKKYEAEGSVSLVKSVLELADYFYARKLIVLKDHGVISIGETMWEAEQKALDLYSQFR